MLKIIFIVLFNIAIATIIIVGFLYEKKQYNSGICKCCGKPLRFFARDNIGCRGYICDNCLNIAWVSFKIDKGTNM